VTRDRRGKGKKVKEGGSCKGEKKHVGGEMLLFAQPNLREAKKKKKRKRISSGGKKERSHE